ncbi:hypothetical protein [Sunxiuqinia dokdonensis]|uniref:hypothetical protein n=1 Tax=Sunxiuqinia dokdonensis TaxID=1409788 RepID=UPI00069D559B|nr:hypothetical protein [Sunxiuqinia dokdonensis]
MEKQIKLEANQTIVVNGAVLNTKVAEQLKTFQENDNESIKDLKGYIAEAICFISKEVLDYTGLDKESRTEYLMNLSSDLSYCRDYLTELEKP